jgi:hypothetical protein
MDIVKNDEIFEMDECCEKSRDFWHFEISFPNKQWGGWMYFGKVVTSSWEKLIVFNTFFFPFLFYAWFLVFPLNIPKWNWDVYTYVNIKVIISQFNLGGLFLEDEKRIFLLLENFLEDIAE